MAAGRAGTWAELESSLIRRLERLEGQMNRWADTCMRFMPREWVEAQGFVMADAVLAAVLLGLVTLSYMMVTHMLSSWGEGWKNTTTGASKPIRATAPVPSDPKAPGGVSGGRSSSCAQYGPVNEEIEGMTALMRASSQGDEFCAAELIAAGASVDARDSQEGFTALLMAAAMGHLGVVHRLLAANADVNAKNNDGATALMLATYAQKEAVVRSLLGSGARQGLNAALAFAEQLDASSSSSLAAALREGLPSNAPTLGYLSGWFSSGEDHGGFDFGFLPLAVGLMVVGFMLLLFQLDADGGDGGDWDYRSEGGHGMAHHSDVAPPRSRRDHTDLSQLTPRERRSLTCRLGEAYQRWNETEGQREAKLHQQRKRVAKQAKLQEEAHSVAVTLREALRLAEQAYEKAAAAAAAANSNGGAGGDAPAQAGSPDGSDASGEAAEATGATGNGHSSGNGHAQSAGPGHAAPSTPTRVDVRAYLERVRNLISEARTLESHSPHLPNLIGVATQRMDELVRLEAERERTEAEDRSRRRAEAQAAKAEELRMRKAETVAAKKLEREKMRKLEAEERARMEEDAAAARAVAEMAAKEAKELQAKREAEAKAAEREEKARAEAKAKELREQKEKAAELAAKVEAEKLAREADERAARQAAARERLAAREAAEKARRAEAERAADKARARREVEAKTKKDAEEKMRRDKEEARMTKAAAMAAAPAPAAALLVAAACTPSSASAAPSIGAPFAGMAPTSAGACSTATAAEEPKPKNRRGRGSRGGAAKDADAATASGASGANRQQAAQPQRGLPRAALPSLSSDSGDSAFPPSLLHLSPNASTAPSALPPPSAGQGSGRNGGGFFDGLGDLFGDMSQASAGHSVGGVLASNVGDTFGGGSAFGLRPTAPAFDPTGAAPSSGVAVPPSPALEAIANGFGSSGFGGIWGGESSAASDFAAGQASFDSGAGAVSSASTGAIGGRRVVGNGPQSDERGSRLLGQLF